MSNKRRIIFILIILRFAYGESISCDVTPRNTEARLLHHLLCQYDNTIRPWTNPKNSTIIRIMMYVKSFDYDYTIGQLNLRTWLSMSWQDEHLTWNINEYGTKTEITIEGDSIWHPDITTYNAEGSQFHQSCTRASCTVTHTGVVSCVPPCVFNAECKEDYTYWPFDTQNCTMHLGSWMRTGEEINYSISPIRITRSAIENMEWKIVSATSRKNIGNYSCCPNETYPTLSFVFLIERHSGAERAIIISPALILAIINLITLWLNPDSIERAAMVIISIFAHLGFLETLAWLVPKNGETAPNILLFFRDSLVISAFLFLLSILLRSLKSCKRPTPSWIQNITDTVQGNKVGQLMFTNPYLIEKNDESQNQSRIEDGQILVDNQPTDEIPSSSIGPKKLIWPAFARFIDTVVFLVLVGCYVIMMSALIPTNYEKRPLTIVEIDE